MARTHTLRHRVQNRQWVVSIGSLMFIQCSHSNSYLWIPNTKKKHNRRYSTLNPSFAYISQSSHSAFSFIHDWPRFEQTTPAPRADVLFSLLSFILFLVCAFDTLISQTERKFNKSLKTVETNKRIYFRKYGRETEARRTENNERWINTE